MKALVSIWICSLVAVAQQVEAPIGGFVMDAEAGSIRPINGFAGAALFGAPLDLGFLARRAVYSSRADAALVVNAEDGRLWIAQGLRRGPLSVAPIPDALPDADLLSWNDAGTDAVVLSRTTQRVQFLSGLPSRARGGAVQSIASVPGDLRALAIDSRGHQAILAASAQSCGGLYRISDGADTELRWLVAATSPVAVGWARDDQDVVFADAASGEVSLLRDVTSDGEWSWSQLASAADGLGRLVGMQVQGSRAWVASLSPDGQTSTGTLSEIDVWAGRIVATVNLPLMPTGLERLDGSGLFAFNQTGPGKPLYLFSTNESTVWFVPPVVR